MPAASRTPLLVSLADIRQVEELPVRYRFATAVVTIGRAAGNSIVLDSPSVSKFHARIDWDGSELRITDLDSRNGIYVNGERLQRPCTLQGSEEVYVGTFALSFGTEERPLSAWGVRRSGGGVRPARLYIGYAPEDAIHREALRTHLSWLQREALIFAWHDHLLTPDTVRVRQQLDELARADAIVLLLSPDYLRSQHSTSVEMRRALQQARSGKSCLIPVVVRPVYLSGGPFDGLQLLPTNGKPVSSWDEKDAAWVHIVEQISRGLRARGGSNV